VQDGEARAEGEDALVVELPADFVQTQTLVCRLEARRRSDTETEWTPLCMPSFRAQSPHEKFGWQRQMAYAAHTVFCRELFQMVRLSSTFSQNVFPHCSYPSTFARRRTRRRTPSKT